jgi:hypothetical protein
VTAIECPQPQGGWGWTLVLLLVCGGVFYVGAGFAYNLRTHGAATPPHVEFWQGLQGLVMDGVTFTRQYGAGASGGGSGSGSGEGEKAQQSGGLESKLLPGAQPSAGAESESEDDDLVE